MWIHVDLVERLCGEYSGITPRPLKHIEARQVNDSSVGCVVNVTLKPTVASRIVSDNPAEAHSSNTQ